jgi:hypothetical protein
MTGTDLVPAGQTVRVIPSEIGPVIPVVDIADYIGCSRSAISKAMKVYEEKMSPCKTFVTLPTSGGSQQFLCVNRVGVDYLFLLVHPSKSKMALDQMLEFRKNILVKIDGGKSSEPAPTIDTELQQARRIAELTGGNLAAFQKIALEKCGCGDYAPALQVPVIVHGESGWFNITQLVAMCNDPLLNPERLNWYLANNPKDPERRPFQYRDENHLWRLTPLGMEHGKEYWYTAPSQHQEIRIAWRESVLYASGLKHPISNDQTALAARV